MLQEGKRFTRIVFRRALHIIDVFNDIYAEGGGIKKFYSSFGAFLLRTVVNTTTRIWGYLSFYDWINPDARRQPKPDFYAYTGIEVGLASRKA
jgi:hypothetical protein